MNCTAHDQLEDCPQNNAGKQNSKQPTAVGLGEQFKMDVLCLIGIGYDTVGTALTFGLREALFSLSMMEKELVPEEKRANFIETLDQVMLASPANWEKHYHGDENHLAQCRKYSYSDRARYYIGQPEVVAAMNKLFDNLREYPIPMNMLHQYMPISYAKIREGQLKLDPRELAMDGIVQFMLDYESAV